MSFALKDTVFLPNSPSITLLPMNMIEALISWSLLISVLLHFHESQSKNYQLAERAYYQTIASIEAGNLLERYRVSPNTEVRQKEFAEWRQGLQQQVPKAKAVVYGVDQSTYIVHVTWWAGGWQAINRVAIVSWS